MRTTLSCLWASVALIALSGCYAASAGGPPAHAAPDPGAADTVYCSRRTDSLTRALIGRFVPYAVTGLRAPADTLMFALLSPRPVEPGRIYPLAVVLTDRAAAAPGDSCRWAEAIMFQTAALEWGAAATEWRRPMYVAVAACSDAASAIEVTRAVMRNWQLDRSRVYICGQGRGAQGAVDAARRCPSVYAAVVTMAADEPEATSRLKIERALAAHTSGF